MNKTLPALEDRKDWPKIKEEIELIEKVKRGDNRAFGILRDRHRKLVTKVAERFCNLVDRERYKDFLQEGDIGLFEAIERYDWRKGTKLSTYARYWIKCKIYKAAAEQRVLPLTEYAYQGMGKILSAKEKLLRSGKSPSLKEISKEADLNLRLVKRLYGYMEGQKTISLDWTLRDDETTIKEVLDLGENEEILAQNRILLKESEEMLDKLAVPEKKKIIFKLRVGWIDLEGAKEEIDKLPIPKENKVILKLRMDLVKIIFELRVGLIEPEKAKEELDKPPIPKDGKIIALRTDLIKLIEEGRYKWKGKKHCMTLEEIGLIFSLSRERINQIVKQVGRKLRKKLSG